MADPVPDAPSARLRGIGAMLAAVALFAVMDGVLKRFAGHYPPLQVVALRGAASLPFVLLPVLVRGHWRALRMHHYPLHLARGVLAVVMMAGFVYALTVLSLADAYALFFISPLLVTALSVPLLGERVGLARWLAIATRLGGALWLLQPSGGGLFADIEGPRAWLGALGALIAALAYALNSIATRTLSRTDSNTSMVFWFLLLMTLGAGVFAVPGWLPLQDGDWPWLGVLGLSGALAQLFITRAFRHAPASVVSPFEYTALLWAVLIDWLAWSVTPSLHILPGAALIIAGGLYLIGRERGG